MGPWRPSDDGSLVHNPYSWTQLANMVFMEQPVGVGFSFSTDDRFSSYDNASYNDYQSALDNLQILNEFYLRFPERQSNDMYLTSESYGGTLILLLFDKVSLIQLFFVSVFSFTWPHLMLNLI